MATYAYACIEFDDNTQRDEPPFTNDCSVWDLTGDYGVSTGKNYRLFAALAGVRREPDGPEPLYLPRGLPPNVSDAAREALASRPVTSWLTAREVREALTHGALDESTLSRSERFLLETIERAAGTYGPERVRIVFAFD